MSNLVKTEFQSLPELSVKENSIISALKSDKIINLNNEDLNRNIVNWANIIYACAGQKVSDDDLKAFCILLKNELKTYFGNIGHKDIETALNNGVRRLYGEYYGINIISVNKWIKSHLDSEERKNAIKKFLTLNKPEEQNMTEDEKENIMKKAIERLEKLIQDDVTINPESIDFGNAVYNYLDNKNLILFTTEEKKQFMEQSKGILLQHLLNQKSRLEITPTLFKRTLESIESVNSLDVVILAKKIAIKKHFVNLIPVKKEIVRDHNHPDYFNKF